MEKVKKILVNLYVIESKAFNTTGEYTKGIEKFVLAENDNKVFDYLDTSEDFNFNNWEAVFEDSISEDLGFENLNGTKTFEKEKALFKQKILEVGGLMNLDEYKGIKINFEHEYGEPEIYHGFKSLGSFEVPENFDLVSCNSLDNISSILFESQLLKQLK